MSKEGLSYLDALNRLASHFQETDSVEVGGFYDFIKDVWAYGYEHPEYFRLRYVELICRDVERALAEGKYYVCVLCRGFFKSTVLGHGFSVWRGLKMKGDVTIPYVSYAHKMSEYHTREIKRHIRSNPKLSSFMVDRSPDSEISCNYRIGGRSVIIEPAGLFAFKRGSHTDGALIADDLLRDPDNPLNLSQIVKVEEHFNRETIYIPNKGAPLILMGTPMTPDDLLTKVCNDERFISRVLPALNPAPDWEVLAPEIRSKEWLLREQQINPRAFSAEFLLSPYSTVLSYIGDNELKQVENSSLLNLNPNVFHELDSDFTFMGMDIGKKRHPTHIVVYISQANSPTLTQIASIFLDGWDYTEQARFANMVVKNFGVDKGYFDNTRSELEDRSLNSALEPIRFTQKNKRRMAQIFEQYIHDKKIAMIQDPRQHAQIVSVDNNLDAPQTPLGGHGDSMWSNALAMMCYNDTTRHGTTIIGDLSDWGNPRGTNVGIQSLRVPRNITTDNEKCPKCNESGGITPSGKCLLCYSDSFYEQFPRSNSDSNFPL